MKAKAFQCGVSGKDRRDSVAHFHCHTGHCYVHHMRPLAHCGTVDPSCKPWLDLSPCLIDLLVNTLYIIFRSAYLTDCGLYFSINSAWYPLTILFSRGRNDNSKLLCLILISCQVFSSVYYLKIDASLGCLIHPFAPSHEP